MDYQHLHARSIAQPEEFWREQARLIEWTRAPDTILDQSRPPFVRWFRDGELNLCANAVDRWAAIDPAQPALIHVSAEADSERVYSREELLAHVQQWAAALRALGVGVGDRVVIYLPMIPEAVFAMLACLRLGAIHSVVFGGFAGHALAARIDDARPKVVIGADAGRRAGKTIRYLPMLEEALAQAEHRPDAVLIVDRGIAGEPLPAGMTDAAAFVAKHHGAVVAPVPVQSTHPSYILYTSGTTGRPKGVQRDTGGYAVALAASMEHIFTGRPGDVFFAASDIGWVVGHSYIVYGPLLAGRATVLYEGTPVHPDPGILWRTAARHRVQTMFAAPTALRLLKGLGEEIGARHDLSALSALFVAGEPLDDSTWSWIAGQLPAQVIDNYWQTETGWPILTLCRGLDDSPPRAGSCGFPVFGYDVRLVDQASGREVGPGERGILAIAQPLPPGTLSTVWGDDGRFAETYFTTLPGCDHYSTFDWGVRDPDGYHFVLGRSDDVINVAGHRLGTREIEEVLCGHALVSEAAVVGVADALKTQVPVAFVVASATADPGLLAAELLERVNREIGAIARPDRLYLVPALPKTRSGKVLRRAIQALLEGRETGDLTMIEDPRALDAIRAAAEPSVVEG